MKQTQLFTFEQFDYTSYTPGVESEMREGNDSNIHSDDAETILRVANEIGGLLQGDVLGFSVLRQTDARSNTGENVRDIVVDMAGRAAGFDIDGTLTKNEYMANVLLADNDKEALGLDEIDGAIQSTVRVVQFGSIATKSDWQVMEIEFPNNLITPQGTVERHNRIFNLTPLNPNKS